MAAEIKMPQLSDTMHAGKILSWMKKEGDSVNRGDILAEVETDKANLQIESFQSGVLLKIVVPADTSAKVGDVIAYVGAAGEVVSANGNAPSAITAAAPAAAAPHTAPAVSAKPITPPPVHSEPLTVVHSSSGDRVKASPLARKIAEQKQIDLRAIHGSGPNGRIVRKDVESAGSAAPDLAHAAPSLAYTRPAASAGTTHAPSAGGGRLIPMTKMRETIARRMQESVAQSPHFYVTTSISMGEAVRLRELLKEREEYKGISLNHLIIKAAAYAISREPRVNRAVRENQIWEPDAINIGIITAIEDGLLIPVIRDANTLSLKDLVFEARAAVERARAGRPNASDLNGGTFSISNMGMFDIENFTAIINPGQGSVLAVSSTKEEPAVESGQIVIAKRMKATISVDHRIIDGVMAGTFLRHFKEALEVPALMLA